MSWLNRIERVVRDQRRAYARGPARPPAYTRACAREENATTTRRAYEGATGASAAVGPTRPASRAQVTATAAAVKAQAAVAIT